MWNIWRDRWADRQTDREYQKSLSKHPKACLLCGLLQGWKVPKSAIFKADGRTNRQTDGRIDPLIEMRSSQMHLNMFTNPYEGHIISPKSYPNRTCIQIPWFNSYWQKAHLHIAVNHDFVYLRVALNLKAEILILNVLECNCQSISSGFFRFKELFFFLLNFRNPFFDLFSTLGWKRPMFIVYNFQVIRTQEGLDFFRLEHPGFKSKCRFFG